MLLTWEVFWPQHYNDKNNKMDNINTNNSNKNNNKVAYFTEQLFLGKEV